MTDRGESVMWKCVCGSMCVYERSRIPLEGWERGRGREADRRGYFRPHQPHSCPRHLLRVLRGHEGDGFWLGFPRPRTLVVLMHGSVTPLLPPPCSCHSSPIGFHETQANVEFSALRLIHCEYKYTTPYSVMIAGSIPNQPPY
jgi:hypothetical protein